LPLLPGFVAHKNLMFISPVEDVLRSLAFGSSVDANTFYVSKFFLPLYVPCEFVNDMFGERLRINGNSGWRDDDPHLIKNLINVIQSEAIPFINSVSSLVGVRDYLKVESIKPRTNSHTLEALAYTLIKCGDYASALKSLAELKRMLQGDTVPWVVAQFNRAQLVEQKLLQSSEEALAQLKVWKVETIRNLKLEEFC